MGYRERGCKFLKRDPGYNLYSYGIGEYERKEKTYNSQLKKTKKFTH